MYDTWTVEDLKQSLDDAVEFASSICIGRSMDDDALLAETEADITKIKAELARREARS